MGTKLKKYYELVQAKEGIKGKMRLAMKTGISSDKAETTPDSDENLKTFYEAAKEIAGADIPSL